MAGSYFAAGVPIKRPLRIGPDASFAVTSIVWSGVNRIDRV
jgi:hypothetical protein